MGLGLVHLGGGTTSGIPSSSLSTHGGGGDEDTAWLFTAVCGKKAWASDEDKAFLNQDSLVRWCILCSWRFSSPDWTKP